MSDAIGRADAARRAADALLGTVGGRTVKLRMPAPGTPGDATEQLGLLTPGFQDVEVGPAVFRRVRARVGAAGEAPRYELLVSATAVEALVGSTAYASVAVLFAGVAGVLVGDRLLFVESCTSSEASGAAYCYRLGLRDAVAVAV